MSMSASDAYYASLLRSIADSRARSEASDAARAAGETKHWYYVHEDYCPVCGKGDVYRERMYTPRPEDWEERHSFHGRYDWCEG